MIVLKKTVYSKKENKLIRKLMDLKRKRLIMKNEIRDIEKKLGWIKF